MADIIETTLDKKTKVEDLLPTTPAIATKETTLTEKIVNDTITLLKDVSGNNGYTAIANKMKLSREQVMEIHTKMQARIAELTPPVEIK